MQKNVDGFDDHDGEARLALALGVSGAAVWELNFKTNEVHVDRRYHEMLGYEMGELPVARRDWPPYHHPDELQAIGLLLILAERIWLT